MRADNIHGPLQWVNERPTEADGLDDERREQERREQEEREREEREREEREREEREREQREREEREREERERERRERESQGSVEGQRHPVASTAADKSARRQQLRERMRACPEQGQKPEAQSTIDARPEESAPAAARDGEHLSNAGKSSPAHPAHIRHAVYGGRAGRSLKRGIDSLTAAGRKLRTRVRASPQWPRAAPASVTEGAPPASVAAPTTSGPATGEPQEPAGHDDRDSSPPSDDELEVRLKLSLREAFVRRTSRIAVGSPKGGVGKSSLAYALAGSISYYTNMRVCLVDADPNFGSTRLLVPRPVSNSVVDLARDADEIQGLSDIRAYVAQNEKMRLDVALGPEHPYELAEFEDLSEAYGRIDSVLGRFYDVILYDLGLGFRDSAIRSILSFSNELLFVSDSEVIPNAMLDDAVKYVQNVGVDLGRTTLALNHRLPPTDESAATEAVRTAHSSSLRRVTEITYDPIMSRLLNQRAFHIEEISQRTRLDLLTTVAASLEGLKDANDGQTATGGARGAGESSRYGAGGISRSPSRNGNGSG